MDYQEKLIHEARKWPCLYDTKSNSYYNIQKKSAAWYNVCKKIFPNWDTWTTEEKNKKGREVQRSWNIFQDTTKMSNKEKKKSAKGFEKDNKKIKSAKDPLKITDQDALNWKKNVSELSSGIKDSVKSDDPTKMFLMSLLPSLNKLSEKSKLLLQIDIIKMIRKRLLPADFHVLDKVKIEGSTSNETSEQIDTMNSILNSPKKIFLFDFKIGTCVICDSIENLRKIEDNNDNESVNYMLLICYNIKFESVSHSINNYEICEQCIKNLISALNFKQRIERKDRFVTNIKEENLPNVLSEENAPSSPDDSEVDECEYIAKMENGGEKKLETSIPEEQGSNDVETTLHPLQPSDVTCPICGESSETHRALLKHYPTHFKKFFCEQCNIQCVNAHSLVRHKTQFHAAKQYACKLCHRKYVTRDSVKRHIREVHKRKKIYCCTVCPERFVEYGARNKHIRFVHGLATRTYNCTTCGKAYDRSSSLSVHIKKVHYRLRDHECNECDKSFYSRGALNNHMLTHTGIRNFKCEHCGKHYGRKKTLVEHLKIHANLRNHVCEICGKAFIQKCTLKGHMKTHEKSNSDQ